MLEMAERTMQVHKRAKLGLTSDVDDNIIQQWKKETSSGKKKWTIR